MTRWPRKFVESIRIARIMIAVGALCIVLHLAAPPALHAHDLYTSGTIVEQRADTLHASIEFHAGDLGRVFGLDRNRDEAIDSVEAAAGMSAIDPYLGEHIRVSWTPHPGSMSEPRSIGHPRSWEWDHDLAGNPTVRFLYAHPASDTVTSFTYQFDLFRDFGEKFLNIGIVTTPAFRSQFLLTVENTSVVVPVPKRSRGGAARFQTGFPAFLKLGVEHIIEGIDHILFLFGLILIGGRFLSLVKIVTAFTIAHSITLALAALEVVALPPALIESAIALSIAYVAVENFWIKSSKKRWIVTGLFGFVHGFGFANVLRDIGLPRDALVSSLLGFNLGVELGQIVIVLAMFPAVLLIARTSWRRSIVWALSAALFVIAIAWFLERAFGLPVGII